MSPAEKKSKFPCVLYLHGNCSSRLEAMDILTTLLPKGISVAALDLSGSGLSEGEYISLGYHEQYDVKVLVEHLRNERHVGIVGLWGRSMGAATSVLRAAEDWTLGALVLDSPFSDLPMVASELVNSQLAVPDFLLSMALQSVRKEILERAKFDIEALLPIKAAPRARTPVLFATAEDDDFVLPHHTYDLHGAWGANIRKLVTFDGGHNGRRPKWFTDEAASFLEHHLVTAYSRPDSPKQSSPTLADPNSRWSQEGMEEAWVSPSILAPEKRDELLPPTTKVLKTNQLNQREAALPPTVRTLGDTLPRTSVLTARPKAKAVSSRAPTAEGSRQSAADQRDIRDHLIGMGFSQDIATQAAARSPSLETALDWTLQESQNMAKESAQALGQLTSLLRAPDRGSVASAFQPMGPTASPEVEAAAAAAGVALRKQLSSLKTSALTELVPDFCDASVTGSDTYYGGSQSNSRTDPTSTSSSGGYQCQLPPTSVMSAPRTQVSLGSNAGNYIALHLA